MNERDGVLEVMEDVVGGEGIEIYEVFSWCVESDLLKSVVCKCGVWIEWRDE